MKISDYLRQKPQRPIKTLIKKLEDSGKRGHLAHITHGNITVIKRTPKKVPMRQKVLKS